MGMAMSVIQSEVFEAFRAIDIPEDKAMKAAAALSKRDEDVFSVLNKHTEEFHVIKAEILLMKWMIGVVVAFQVAIFVKLFVH